MLFRLCEQLGFPHPDYLAPFLSSKQLVEWKAYSEQYGYRHDLQFGLLQQAILSSWGNDVSLYDCLPYQDIQPDPELVTFKLQELFPGLKPKY